jgi:hypothetical protein
MLGAVAVTVAVSRLVVPSETWAGRETTRSVVLGRAGLELPDRMSLSSVIEAGSVLACAS